MKLPYPPEHIARFSAYYYQYIGCEAFLRNPHEIIDNYSAYEPFIIQRIRQIDGSDGFVWCADNVQNIQALWIPPFALGAVLQDGLAQFKQKQGIVFTGTDEWQQDTEQGIDRRWTNGLVLFAVPDPADEGVYLLLSPFKLSIPDYGL